jgi:hypothetical protein
LQARRKQVTDTAENLTFMKDGLPFAFIQGVRAAEL